MRGSRATTSASSRMRSTWPPSRDPYPKSPTHVLLAFAAPAEPHLLTSSSLLRAALAGGRVRRQRLPGSRPGLHSGARARRLGLAGGRGHRGAGRVGGAGQQCTRHRGPAGAAVTRGGPPLPCRRGSCCGTRILGIACCNVAQDCSKRDLPDPAELRFWTRPPVRLVCARMRRAVGESCKQELQAARRVPSGLRRPPHASTHSVHRRYAIAVTQQRDVQPLGSARHPSSAIVQHSRGSDAAMTSCVPASASSCSLADTAEPTP
jgi:hypothetical protein